MSKTAEQHSIEDIEKEMEGLKKEARQTEAWLTYRSRLQGEQIAEREALIRDAFEAGFQKGEGNDRWGYFGLGWFAGAAVFGVTVVMLNSL